MKTKLQYILALASAFALIHANAVAQTSKPVFPHLGDTKEQCIARNGKITKTYLGQSFFPAVDGCDLSIIFAENKAIEIILTKSRPPIAKATIDKVLEANAEGGTWLIDNGRKPKQDYVEYRYYFRTDRRATAEYAVRGKDGMVAAFGGDPDTMITTLIVSIGEPTAK